MFVTLLVGTRSQSSQTSEFIVETPYYSSTMSVQWFASSLTIEEVIAEIFLSRKITRGDQYRLMCVWLYDPLEEQERTLIDRLFYGIRHGLLQIVD
jgi:hypothetical protein